MSADEQPRDDEPPEVMAIGYARQAEAYRVAVLRVHPEGASHSEVGLLMPAWHLLCHSSELALKAYLLSNGADPSGRKGGLKHHTLRHNLVGLYELAVARGFTPPDDYFGELMKGLAPFHTEHVFRYRKTGWISLPTPSHIGELLQPIIAGIAKTAGASWMAKQEPGRADRELHQVGLTHALPSESAE